MLKVSDVPKSVECKVNGRMVEMSLDLATGLEFLVAHESQGKVAGAYQVGYDVYDSALYPDLTFQVKHTIKKQKNGKRLTYNWAGNIRYQADYYILFAVGDGELLPFLLPYAIWKKSGSVYRKESGARKMKMRRVCISTTMFSKRGSRSYVTQNHLWKCLISDWPRGLHRRLSDHQQLTFDSFVPI